MYAQQFIWSLSGSLAGKKDFRINIQQKISRLRKCCHFFLLLWIGKCLLFFDFSTWKNWFQIADCFSKISCFEYFLLVEALNTYRKCCDLGFVVLKPSLGWSWGAHWERCSEKAELVNPFNNFIYRIYITVMQTETQS